MAFSPSQSPQHKTVDSLYLNRLSAGASNLQGTEQDVVFFQEYTKQHGLDVPVEVETRTLQEVLEVKELIQNNSSLRIDRVMLDNMTTLDKSKEGE